MGINGGAARAPYAAVDETADRRAPEARRLDQVKREDAPGTALAFALLAWAGSGVAQQVALELERVEVIGIAHRADRLVEDVAPTVSVISRDDIEREVSVTLRDLLRYEPGLSIENAPTRFGLGGANIRGLDGNRVQMLLDGIRLPEAYRVGSFSNANRNQLGLGLLQKVEILRGPGSALYGSDALAGVIAFKTVDPADLLKGQRRAAVTADLGYAQASDSVQGGVAIAARGQRLEGLLGYQRSDGHETDNFGANDVIGTARTTPNPQRTTTESWLAKLVLPTSTATWKLTLDRFERGTATDVLSLNPQSSRTVSLSGDDVSSRERASVDAEFAKAGPFERLRALAYVQRTLTRDNTVEVRANTTATCLSAIGTISCRREAQFRFEQTERGASLVGEFEGLGRWVAGVDVARVNGDELRDGQQTNLSTGAVSKVVGGEPLPTRDFPLSTTDRIGAFAQGEIDLAARSLTLIPALRYDRQRLTARADSVFATGNPGRDVVGGEDDAVSPKFGALWRASRTTTFSAQWATGFRAPPAADINIGLTSLPAGYAVLPNPDLRPEHSQGFEFGVRGRHPGFDYTVTVFDTRYRNLIVSRAALPCPGDPRCVSGATGTFQSQNVSRARIFGAEATALYRLRPGWAIQATLSHAEGDDTGRERPLNTVDPTRAIAGLLYDRGGRSAGLHVTHVAAKRRIDGSAGALFATPAYTVVDATASIELCKGVRLSAGVFNLLDRKYWLWSDVRSVLNAGATIDRYTQPGRNVSVLLRASL